MRLLVSFAAVPLLLSAESIVIDAGLDRPKNISISGKDWSMECVRSLGDANAGLMVILMGTGGGGKNLIQDDWWGGQARRYNIGIIAVDFHTDLSLQALDEGHLSLTDGAYDALLGVVKASLDEIAGKKAIFYGFSAGARFLHRFIGHESADIVAFLSGHEHLGVFYAPGWLNEANVSKSMGRYVFAVGERDYDRWYEVWSGYCGYRKEGMITMWKEIPATGHAWSRNLDEFVWECAGAMVDGALTVSPKALHGQGIDEQIMGTDPMISMELGREAP